MSREQVKCLYRGERAAGCYGAGSGDDGCIVRSSARR